MKTRVRHSWEILASSYWFVPSLMMAAGAGLALGMGAVDVSLATRAARPGWVDGVGPEGARQLLATLAGSVITVAGVGFSITMVTLTQASTQFGPRLLRNFMRDTGNQVVLGTWVGTFIYAILVLRTVQGGEGRTFVPHASVSTAVVLALACIIALVYFIHHVSLSLQAPQEVAAVGRDLHRVVDRMFPGRLGRDGARPAEERGHPALQFGRDKAAVMIRLLEVIADLAGRLRTQEQRDALRRHARLVFEEALAALPSAHNRADVEDRYRKATAVLEGGERPAAPASVAAPPPETLLAFAGVARRL